MLGRISLLIGLAVGIIADCPVYSQQYVISTVAGGVPAATPFPAINSSTEYPQGVAADRAGNVYFSSGHCVYKVDAVGTLTRFAGTGRGGYSGDGGPAANAQLLYPQGVSIDATGTVYIADTYNQLVRKVTPDGTISRVAGNLRGIYSGDGGMATNAGLDSPISVTTDAVGNVYIGTYYDNRVRKVDTAGVIHTLAGNGTAGFSGDGGPSTSAMLHSPYGLATDITGNLYVADTFNYRLRRIGLDGTITTVAGSTTFGFSGDGGRSTGALLGYPYGVAVDAVGNIFIADNGTQRIRMINSLGVISTIAGQGNSGVLGDGVALNGHLYEPNAVAVDGNRNVYVSDNFDNRIRKISQASGLISTVAGNGTANFSGDGGPAATAQFSGPGGLALDGSGSLYVEDNYRVRRISSSGIVTTVAGNGMMGYGGDGGLATSAQVFGDGLGVDAAGDLLIADLFNARVRKVTPTGIISSIAGTGLMGNSPDGTVATIAQLGAPSSVLVDRSGDVIFSDSNDNSVRKISPGGILSTIAGSGIKGFAGDGGPAISAQLNNPRGLAFDAAGNLYIGDAGNSRIRKVTEAGLISTIAGTGVQGFGGDGGLATNARFNGFMELAIDRSGNLYISDNNRIRKIFTTGLITTIGGNGLYGYSGDGKTAISAFLSDPSDLAVDAGGNIYFSDSGNDAVRLLTASPCTYSLAQNQAQALGTGSVTTIAINAASTCPWTITSLPDWIAVDQNLAVGYLGTTSVLLRVSANTGAARSTQILVAGLTLTVNQGPAFLISNGGIVNGASFAKQVAPGSIASVFGMFNLSAPVGASGLPVPTTLGGLSFSVGTNAAPIYFANGTQANIQIPWEASGQPAIRAATNGQLSAAQTISLAAYSPGIFTVGAAAQGAIQDSNFQPIDGTNPAVAGTTVVQIYCSGLGPVSNQPATGAPSPSDPAAMTTMLPVVNIGGATADVLFSGLTPGSVGLYQVNALVPAAAQKGAAVPVSITIGGVSSNIVTLAVQ